MEVIKTKENHKKHNYHKKKSESKLDKLPDNKSYNYRYYKKSPERDLKTKQKHYKSNKRMTYNGYKHLVFKNNFIPNILKPKLYTSFLCT